MNTFRFSPTESGFSQQRLGNYQLIQLLGSGGFARVYLGKHTYLNTLAAVKVLDASQEDVDVEKFLVEARIAASLQHPHIIRVLECGLESGWLPYLIMDYAPNGTLHLLHSDGSPLPPKLIIRYVRQIASALRFIHERGFIHRDIKPANVLLGYDHRLLLADFGIAMATHEAAATDEELCFGTVLYTAPEQIIGSPCQASDQYALGIMVYEWLTGRLPFQGQLASIAYQHLYGTPPSLCDTNPAIPVAVESVVLRSLAKSPQDRFSSVQAFARALEEAFDDKPTIELQATVNDPTTDRVPRRGRRRRHNPWKEILTLYTLNLFIGVALIIAMYALGIASQLLWFLLVLCILLTPVGWAMTRKNYQIFFPTVTIVIVAGFTAIVFQNLILFVVTYLTLLLFSLLMSLSAIIHGY